MNVPNAAARQSREQLAEVARINALPQGGQPVRSTDITVGGKSLNITTDKSGRVTITKSTGQPAVPPDRPPDPNEADPALPGQPGPAVFTAEPMTTGHKDIPRGAVDMAIGFFIMCAVMVVGWPLARALGRRIERGASAPAVGPPIAAQLQRIEQAVESMAIEVERISESQRFVAKLQSRSEERV